MFGWIPTQLLMSLRYSVMSRGREEIELDILFGSKEGKIGIQIEGNDINLQTICNIICFTRILTAGI